MRILLLSSRFGSKVPDPMIDERIYVGTFIYGLRKSWAAG